MVLPTALLAKRSVAYPNTDVPFSESEDRGTFPCPWLELSDRQHGYGCSGDDRRGKTRHEKIKRLMSEVLLCGGDPLSRSQRRCETERSCVCSARPISAGTLGRRRLGKAWPSGRNPRRRYGLSIASALRDHRDAF